MSALPPIVNRIPPGLLRVLGINNTGRNPGALVEAYQPSVEMLEWLFTQSEQTVQANGAAIAAVSGLALTVGTSLVVPQNEWWYVKSCAGVVRPTTQCTAALGWLMTVSGVPAMIYVSETAVIPQNADWYFSTASGFFAPPGAQPQLAYSNQVGSTAWGVQASVVRLPI